MPAPTSNLDPALLVLNIKHQVTEEFLRDIIVNSRHSIQYWAPEGRELLAGEYVAFEWDEAEDKKEAEHIISAMKIMDGIQKVFEPGFSLRADIRAAIFQGVMENDAGHIDADGTDAIVQAACFGELKYG